MSLENVKLPFLKISALPDKFSVCVSNNSEEVTRYTKDNLFQRVLHVTLVDKDGGHPIKLSPPDNFLSLSNHAQKVFRKMGITHLDELKGKIVSFKKVTVEGFTTPTIEPTKIDPW